MFLYPARLHRAAGAPALRLTAAGLLFAAGLAVGAAFVPGSGPVGTVTPAAAATNALATLPAPAATAYATEVVRVIDGDTFEARVLVWPGLSMSTKVRLHGVDAPEPRTRCDAERQQAEAATRALEALLSHGDVRIHQVTPDKYGGRVVARVSTKLTPDIAAVLLREGVVRESQRGRRAGWC